MSIRIHRGTPRRYGEDGVPIIAKLRDALSVPVFFEKNAVGMSMDSSTEHRVRVMVFVDFWNFQLSINDLVDDFKVDWRQLGPVVAQESLRLVDPKALISYEGMNVYGSYGDSEKDQRLRRWASTTLARFPGIQVTMIPRQHKRTGPVCPVCREQMTRCPKCGADMRGTEEKGVDTRIATDMIKLAWVDSYDVAVLLSSDRDFVPVVEFLGTRGTKVIHGAFPPQGSMLTQACWGNLPVPKVMEHFRRA